MTSFCDFIQSDYFLDKDGMVCLAEATGNANSDNGFYFYEMKVVNLMYGSIQTGNGSYMNTDSTFWAFTEQNNTCSEYPLSGNSEGQYIMAATYKEMGYSFLTCSHDAFLYESTMIGAIINESSLFTEIPWEMDTIQANQLPQIVNNCTNCLLNLDLSATHNAPFVYEAGSTLTSTAFVNNNIVYKAGDRVRLVPGFKTNMLVDFGVYLESCY